MRKRNQNGASLIELMIATVLFGIILSMISVALGRLLRAPQHANIRLQAHALALDQLEELKAKPYALLLPTFSPDAKDCECSGPSVVSAIESLNRNHHTYQ